MIDKLILNQSERLVLQCSIEANPWCDHIRWLFNEKELITQACSKDKVVEYRIENVDRLHAGKYTCEVKNSLNISYAQRYDGISVVSTDVRIQCK